MESQNLSVDPTHWIESRCTALFDSMESNQALVQGRTDWGRKCLKLRGEALLDKKTKFLNDTGMVDPTLELEFNFDGMALAIVNEGGAPFTPGSRWFYPSFGVTVGTQPQNPDHVVAPVDANDDCGTAYQVDTNSKWLGKVQLDLLNKYHLAAMCVMGCYTPDQQVLYKGGYEAIGAALVRHESEVMSLTANSTLERPEFSPITIDAYTADIRDASQEILDITTRSGKGLSVTKNHPVLDFEGKMHPAEVFKVGDLLVTTDGGLDPITSISGRSYYGKVYNFRVQSIDPKRNIVSAQGILTGSVYFQNEGVRDLNRALFRAELPSALF